MKPAQSDFPTRASFCGLQDEYPNERCPVCLEFATPRETAEIPCGHVVHAACLRLLAASGQAECPVCRRVFDPKIAAARKQMGQLEHNIASFALLKARNGMLRANIIENYLRLSAELQKVRYRIAALNEQQKRLGYKRELLETSIRFLKKQRGCQADGLDPIRYAALQSLNYPYGQAVSACRNLPPVQDYVRQRQCEQATGRENYDSMCSRDGTAIHTSCQLQKEISRLELQLRDLDFYQCELRRELDRLVDREAMQRMMLERTQRAQIMCYQGEVKASVLRKTIKSQFGTLETQQKESLDHAPSGLYTLPPLIPGGDAIQEEERLRKQRSAEQTGYLAQLDARFEKIAGRGYIL